MPASNKKSIKNGIFNRIASDLAMRYGISRETGDYTSFNRGVDMMRDEANAHKFTKKDYERLGRAFRKMVE